MILALLLSTAATNASVAEPHSSLCDRAAGRAARETGVPEDVLRAITRTETGRARHGRLEPWPWTVNMEGKGHWFATRAEATDYAQRHFRRGARSFDVGCFQINYRWHGQAFPSIDTMFDPQANARYAARFLARLHAETGSWPDAAAAYHSRTPRHADRYRARFQRIHARLDAAPAPPPPAQPGAESRRNSFPLFRPSGTAPSSLGSLFPSGAAGANPLFPDTAG